MRTTPTPAEKPSAPMAPAPEVTRAVVFSVAVTVMFPVASRLA